MDDLSYPATSLPRTVTKLVPYRIKKIHTNYSEVSRRLTRDERATRDLDIPYSVMFIINCSMEEFCDILNNKSLGKDQIDLCRDIRKRGKNKASDDKIEEDESHQFAFRLLLRIVGRGRLTKSHI